MDEITTAVGGSPKQEGQAGPEVRQRLVSDEQAAMLDRTKLGDESPYYIREPLKGENHAAN